MPKGRERGREEEREVEREREKEVGGGRSSAIGDGGQAAVSLTPDLDGTGSGSLLEPDARSHL